MPRMYGRDDQPIPGYRLSEFLGRGGFGEVWKASAPGGTECAIKIINLGDKQGLKEFRAIRLVKRIHHPHLTPIIAFWLKDEQGNILEDAGEADSMWLKGQEAELIIAMGLGDKNLADRLKEYRSQGKQGIPAEELLDYMEEAAKAIDFLNQPRHDLGSGPAAIQHCDIKPQNILIVGGSAQVCDFGLARQLNDARKTSMAAGTYAYIAPESIENKSSKTNDQYSLAISYVELRTGYLPFSANSLYEVMFAHLQGKLDFSKVTEAERPVLKRATAVNPEERFPSTLEMVRALRRAVEGKITSKPEVSVSGKPREHLRPGTEIVPGYKLDAFIGRGGYGEVWKAMAPGGKPVAVKIIRNLEAGGGKQEFKALELLKSVDHNHLMELHAYWLLDSNGVIIPDEVREQGNAPPATTMVIATKLANKNLLQRLQECRREQGGEGGIPLPELLGYMRQAASAIDHLNALIHLMGDRKVSIQHRDIKPENILLAANTVKVTDFGLAKVLEGATAVINQDSAGLTLSYAAPEVFSNKVTSWSDQYSLAVTYFHLRIGALPFRASSPTQIFMIHVEGKLDLAILPEAERAVILRATSVEPSKRFPTCMDMVEALAEACGLTDPGIGVPTPRPDSKAIIQEKQAPDTGRRVPPSGPKSTKPATSSPTDPSTPSSPPFPKTSPSLPSAPVGPKSAPSTPGSGRPSEGTKPSPGEPAPPSTPSQPAVKPEFNPYVTLTTDAPMVPPPASETKQDTAPGVPFEVDTDPPVPLDLEARTLQEIKAEQTVKPWLPSEAETKTPARQSEWKKPVAAPPSEERKKQPVVRYKIVVKIVVTLCVVGVLVGGAGYGLYVLLKPKPPEPAAVIARLIEEGNPDEAYKSLDESKGRVQGREEELLAAILKLWQRQLVDLTDQDRYGDAHARLEELKKKLHVKEFEDLRREVFVDWHGQVTQRIAKDQFDEVFAKLKGLKDDLPDEQIKELHQKNAEKWLGSVDKQFAAKHYNAAAQGLQKLLASYPGNEKTGKLKEQLEAKAKELDTLREKAKAEVTAKTWEKALDIAETLKRDFPEETDAARQLRGDALKCALEAGRKPLEDVRDAKTVSDACEHFEQAYRISQRIKRKDEPSGAALAKEVVDKWVRYGNDLLTKQPEDAVAVAKKIHDTLNYDDARVTKLEQDATRWVKQKAQLKDATALVEQLADAMAKGDGAKAHVLAGRLRTEFDNIPAEGDGQVLIQNQLAEKSKAVLTLAVAKGTAAKDVRDLVRDLEGFNLKQAAFELTLAKAVASAKEKKYRDFRSLLSEARAAQIRHPEELEQVLGYVAQLGAEQADIATEDFTALLDECKATLAEPPSAERAALATGYCRLVENLVGRRLADATDLLEYKHLPTHCQAAWDTGQAEALTSAYFAEGLLVQENGELKPSPDPADLDKARNATAKVDAPPKGHPYARYVRSLVYYADVDYREAANQLDLAGFRKSKDEPWQNWQNEMRRKLAGRSYAKAGDAVKKQADQAFAYYLSAIKLNPILEADYARALAESAYDSKHFDVSERTTGKLLEKDPKKLPEDAYQLALLNAKSRAELGKTDADKMVAALSRYEEINRWREENKEFMEGLGVVDFYNEVLDPALTLGEAAWRVQPRLKTRVAKLHGAKGKLILDNRFKDWKFGKEPEFGKDPVREAADAFERAFDLYPDKRHKDLAPYYAHHGFALVALYPLDLKTIETDWKTAIAIDGNEPWGWALRGQYLQDNARLTSVLSDKLTFAKDSIKYFLRAADTVPDPEKAKSKAFLSYCHVRCSDAYVLIAHIRNGADKTQIKADLKEAENEAQQAVNSMPKSQLAMLALANALEDTAWSDLGNQPALYPAAEKAFLSAIQAHDANLDLKVGLARLYIKWAEDVPKTEGKRSGDARERLEKVLKKNPKHLEANYWMGKVLWNGGNQQEAYRYFANALAHPSQGWAWLSPIIRTFGRIALDDWQHLFEIALPKDRKYNAKHAPALYLKCQVLANSEEFLTKDLARAKPRIIEDADVLAALLKDPFYKAAALRVAALARIKAMGLPTHQDQVSTYRHDAIENMRQLLNLDPNDINALKWAKALASQADGYADDEEYSVGVRIEALDDAVKQLGPRIKKASQDEQDEWKPRLSTLEGKLNSLKKKKP